MKKRITIVGGGPAGLFSAYQLLKRGYEVALYDQMSGVGKKFLVAGNGGLNLTHSENLDVFCTRYGKDEEYFSELISEFTPNDLRSFCEELDVSTFVGTSRRVFPENLKAAQILLNWLKKLKSNSNFSLHLKHKLVEVSKDKTLRFEFDNQVIEVKTENVVFALGGASWEKTGSDGKWKTFFEKLNIEISPFLPMNCGFEREWSDHFISQVDRTPLKNVAIKVLNKEVRGEVMLTPFGIEGGGIYAVSNIIRDQILESGLAEVYLDLKPDLKEDEIIKKLKAKKAKVSLSNHLRKALKLDKVMTVLLRELVASDDFNDVELLSKHIKNLKIDLHSMRPLSEAISTAGGVSFQELSPNLELNEYPGFYVIGEMLDYEAPTGGYLLQGCFSTAWRVVEAIDGKK